MTAVYSCVRILSETIVGLTIAFDIKDKSMMKLGKRILTDICKAFCDETEKMVIML